MRINNNLMAMNTHRQLGINNTATSKSLEKLSSGFRINRAGDDAAGLAISEKMRGQIRGLNMASKNAQDGISLIQTAEGGLNETHAILQRMRELAIQSANDTNVAVDRSEIQKEIDQLTKEISRIGQTTEFNTQNLLAGEFDGTFHIGANQGQNLSLKIADMRANSLAVTGQAKIELEADTSGAASIKDNDADGTYTIDGTNLKDSKGTIVATTTDHKTWTGNGNGAIADAETIVFKQEVDSGNITILNNKVTGTAQFDSKLEAGDYKYDSAKKQLLDGGGNVIANSEDGIEFTSAKDGTTVLLTLDADQGADFELSIGGIDVSTQKTADSAITTINNAIETVSTERSKLGALQNRLEHTIKNLDTSAENLQAAESRIRDVDMAKEMMEFTKQNILQQAATAMLAQANQAPQTVLQLLR
ncbi:flagellin N-terminal helical domain-containing protein [Anaerosalibacter bizertensis]|uniref:flagellin N-terminal helical domain-containing protein n=1 Tax=Anaerosalibacter bizertensis TaxID=932217 RepID=UPI003513C521